MKKTLAAIVLLGLGTITAVALAQPPDGPPRGDGPGPGGPHGPPPSPVIEALDTDHDHLISAEEIAKASESLKKCDKNGDGKLTEDETRPPRPPRGRGPGGPDEFGPPPRGPRGEGRDEVRRGDGPAEDGPREVRRGRRGGPGGAGGPGGDGRGPGRGGPGGPEGPPPHAFGPPPFPPPHVFEEIGLSEDQQDQLKALHKETREKFEKILTADQLEKLKEFGPPGPPRE